MYGVYSQQASGGGVSVPEVLIIGGINSRIFRSTDDGVSFTTQIVYHPSQPSTPVAWDKVFYCNGKFFISGNYGCMVSHDYGLTWVNIINQHMSSIVWNGTYFFAGINYQVRRSADLVTWTNVSTQGISHNRADDLCVVDNNVYWSINRDTTIGNSSFLGIRKCVPPYNSSGAFPVPNHTSIPNGTNGYLYQTSNGLVLTTSGGGTQQRIYSTTNYTSFTAAAPGYSVSASLEFDIVVGDQVFKFGSTSDVIRGRGTPVIDALYTTTHPNNNRVNTIDTDGTTFVAAYGSTRIFTREVTANTTAWTSSSFIFIPNTVFYTGKSFLVFNNLSLRRSETGIGGWSIVITPFGSNGTATINKNKIASSYKI